MYTCQLIQKVNMHGTTPLLGARPESFDALMQKGLGVAGTPDSVLAFLGEQLEDCGANYLVGQFSFGDLSQQEVLHSAGIFAREVLPLARERVAQAV